MTTLDQVNNVEGRRILLIVLPRNALQMAYFFVGIAELDDEGITLRGKSGVRVVYVSARRHAIDGFPADVLPSLIVSEHYPAVAALAVGVEECAATFSPREPVGGLAIRDAFFAFGEGATGQPLIFQGNNEHDD
jgi:hypothetical protein